METTNSPGGKDEHNYVPHIQYEDETCKSHFELPDGKRAYATAEYQRWLEDKIRALHNQLSQLRSERDEANSNLESAFILNRSLQHKINQLEKPVLIIGEPLRESKTPCSGKHRWKSFTELQTNGSTSYCADCGIED